MTGRTPLIAGNWKMHKTVAEAEDFIQALLPRVSTADGVDVAICPPFTALTAMVDSTRGSRVQVFAQNMHQAEAGAFTGEVSAAMLSELDIQGVILGHSERRELFGETDKALALKVPARWAPGCFRFCVSGRPRPSANRATPSASCATRSRRVSSKVAAEQIAGLAIAYEPIWAIGTGKVAEPEQAQEAAAFIRALIADRAPEQAQQARILYGGSVKPENAAELLALPDIDGALVGGASLDAQGLATIVAAAG